MAALTICDADVGGLNRLLHTRRVSFSWPSHFFVRSHSSISAGLNLASLPIR